ncbi:hypothetical protein TKK_0010550 [Trichogramma kaykai]
MEKDESKKLLLGTEGYVVNMVKEEMLTKNLSLYDLVQCRVEDAKDLLKYEDYLRYASQSTMVWSDICAQRLCETAARGFFRRWIGRLGHQEVPAECPGGIVDGLSNRELCDIFLRAEEKSSQLVCSSS